MDGGERTGSRRRGGRGSRARRSHERARRNRAARGRRDESGGKTDGSDRGRKQTEGTMTTTTNERDPLIVWLEEVRDFAGATPRAREMAQQAIERLTPPALDPVTEAAAAE